MTLRWIAFSLPLVLSACGGFGTTRVPDERPPMGEFRLGHNIVVAKNAEKVPISREATVEELEGAIKLAVQERLGSYEGRKYFHIGTNVDAYALAPPGVPVVVSPKSVLLITVNLWDDAKQEKIAPPKQFTIWENLTGETAVGSGLTQSAEQQLRNLSLNAAREIQDWMLENPQWFEVTDEERAELDRIEAEYNAQNPDPTPHAAPIAAQPAGDVTVVTN